MERMTAQAIMSLYDEQLKNAQKIQRKIIPKANSFRSPYYSFFSYLKPFRRVGGDFFDFRIFDDNFVSLVLADATGHGIDAAMLTGMVKLSYSYAMENAEEERSPSKVIKRIDNDIENTLDFTFFSCIAILLDPENEKLYWMNAGHPSAFLISQNKKIIQLNAILPLIGMHSMLSLKEQGDRFLDFGPGDKLILYTDGLTEAKNVKGVEYSPQRIEKLINRYPDTEIDTLCQMIINDYTEFTRGTEANDDVCLLGIQYD